MFVLTIVHYQMDILENILSSLIFGYIIIKCLLSCLKIGFTVSKQNCLT